MLVSEIRHRRFNLSFQLFYHSLVLFVKISDFMFSLGGYNSLFARYFKLLIVELIDELNDLRPHRRFCELNEYRGPRVVLAGRPEGLRLLLDFRHGV